MEEEGSPVVRGESRQADNATGVRGKDVHFGFYPILILGQMRTGARQKSVKGRGKKKKNHPTCINTRLI